MNVISQLFISNVIDFLDRQICVFKRKNPKKHLQNNVYSALSNIIAQFSFSWE